MSLMSKYYSMAEVKEMVETLAKMIKESGYAYKRLVIVLEGGRVAGEMLASILKLPVVYVKFRHYDDRVRLDRVEVVSFEDSIRDGDIVFDDVYETGMTVETIFALSGKRVPVAVLVRKTGVEAIGVPDFYAKEESDWVEFCWELKMDGKSQS